MKRHPQRQSVTAPELLVAGAGNPYMVSIILFALFFVSTSYLPFATEFQTRSNSYWLTPYALWGIGIPAGILCCIYLAEFVVSSPVGQAIMRQNMPLVLLYGLAIFSLAYTPRLGSIGPRYWDLVIVSATMLALFIASGGEHYQRRLYAFLSFLLAISYFLVMFYPSIGVHLESAFNVQAVTGESLGGWKGIFWYKNTSGAVFACLTVIAASEAIQKPKFSVVDAVLSVFAFFFVYMSRDKTALAAIPVSMVLLWLFKSASSTGSAVRWFVSVSFAATLCLWAAITVALLFPVFHIDFSQRADIWRVEFAYWSLHPVLGAGFGAVHDVGGISSFNPGWQTTMPHAHNGYVEVLAQLGVVGEALLFWCICLTTNNLMTVLSNGATKEIMGQSLCYFIILISCLSEANMMSGRFLWGMLLVSIVCINFVAARCGQLPVPRARSKRKSIRLRRRPAPSFGATR